MADVVDDVEAGDALLLEQIDGVRVALAEHGHEQVSVGDSVALGSLGVHERPLQHPLEAQRLLRHGVRVVRHDLDLLGQERLEIDAQLAQISATVADDVDDTRVVEHRQQQVLEQQELVPPGPHVLDGALKGLLEFGGKHYSGSMLSCSGYSYRRASCSVFAILVSATSYG